MSPQRSTAWAARLLLFSALLLGVAAMHTIGHPTGQGGGHSAGHSASQPSAQTPAEHKPADTAGHSGAAEAAPGQGPAPHPAAPDRPLPEGHGGHGAAPAAPAAEPGAHPAQSGEHSEPLGGMDPGMDAMSVCLAVLSTFSVLTLLTSGLLAAGRQRTGRLLAEALTRAHRAMPAQPPPRSAYSGYLTQLSVLRL